MTVTAVAVQCHTEGPGEPGTHGALKSMGCWGAVLLLPASPPVEPGARRHTGHDGQPGPPRGLVTHSWAAGTPAGHLPCAGREAVSTAGQPVLSWMPWGRERADTAGRRWLCRARQGCHGSGQLLGWRPKATAGRRRPGKVRVENGSAGPRGGGSPEPTHVPLQSTGNRRGRRTAVRRPGTAVAGDLATEKSQWPLGGEDRGLAGSPPPLPH